MTRPLFFVTLILASVVSISAMAAETLREIRINGAQRVEPATVLTYLNLQTGQPLTDETMNQGLKNLFATGLFAGKVELAHHQVCGFIIAHLAGLSFDVNDDSQGAPKTIF